MPTEFLRRWWKTLTSVSAVLAVITSLLAFESNYVTAAELDVTIKGARKEFQIQLDVNRISSLKQQRYSLMRELGSTPDNPYLTEEKGFLDNEITSIEARLRKNTTGE